MVYRFLRGINRGLCLLSEQSNHKACSITMGSQKPWFTKSCSQMFGQIQYLLSRLYGSSSSQNEFTVVIEGNIGSGKTSLLEYFNNSPNVQTFMEPVKKWRDVRGHNALAKMYEDPSRWALTFQTYVQLTMLETHIAKQTKPVKLMERSIYSARYCFVENLLRSGKMPAFEGIVLDRWFDFIIQNQDCHVDLIVYLQTRPEILYERIKKRGRKEEKPIPIEYLESLHTLHEDWLIRQTTPPLPLTGRGKPTPVIVLDANQDLDGMYEQFEQNRGQILHGYT